MKNDRDLNLKIKENNILDLTSIHDWFILLYKDTSRTPTEANFKSTVLKLK